MTYYELLSDKLDDDEINKQVDERNKSTKESDNRPQVGQVNENFGKLIDRTENEKLIKKIKKNEKEIRESKKTIMDMPLKDIFEKTSDVTSDFWEDYKVKLSEIEINEKLNNKDYKDNKNWSDIIKIHLLAFVEYMKDNDHSLYIGILFVIVSVILYLFNITKG